VTQTRSVHRERGSYIVHLITHVNWPFILSITWEESAESYRWRQFSRVEAETRYGYRWRLKRI